MRYFTQYGTMCNEYHEREFYYCHANTIESKSYALSRLNPLKSLWRSSKTTTNRLRRTVIASFPV